MVLYDAASPIFLCSMLLHRLTVNKNKKAILLADEEVYNERNVSLIQFANTNIFEKIILCYSKSGLKNRGKSQIEIEDIIIKNYDKLFQETEINIREMEQIITTSDWYGEFGVYLSLKNIKYFWLESGTDTAKKIHDIMYIESTMKGKNSKYISVYKRYNGASANGEYVNPILNVNSYKSIEWLNFKECVFWDPSKLVNDILNEDINKIFSAYEFNYELENSLNEDQAKVMFVLQNSGWSFFNFDKKLLSSQIYSDFDRFNIRAIYANQLALDYYIPQNEKVYIKAHPNSPYSLKEVKKYFGENYETFGTVASEFLFQYLKRKNIKFSAILSYGSTANSYMSDLCDKSIGLTLEYWNTYFLYNSIYAALIFAVEDLKQIQNYYCSNILKIQCEQLLVHVINAEKTVVEIPQNFAFSANSFVLVNRIEEKDRERWLECLRQLPNDVTVCFINVCEDYMFFSEDISEFFVPIRIDKEQIKEDSLDPMRSETLFVFTKNNGVRQAGRNFKHEKILPRVGVKLVVKKLSVSEIVDIHQIAQNIINIAEVKNMREELNNIKNENIALKNVVFSMLAESPRAYIHLVKSEKNITAYLIWLKRLSKDFFVIVAIKDTPGKFVDKKLHDLLAEAGFVNFPIAPNLWRTYIGVIDEGQLIYETTGNNEDPSYWSEKVNEYDFNIKSEAYRKGNLCEIKINNIDYAVNKRGINIVVFDKANGEIVDSVAFDTHIRVCPCFRK